MTSRFLPVLAFLAPSVLSAIPTGYTTELFYDDFSTFPANWVFDNGHSYPGGPTNWGTGEIQEYTQSPDNIAVRNGNLVITPLKSPSGLWTSSRIETTPQYDFTCAAGGKLWVEGSIKLGANPSDSSMGIWPAFWLLGAPYRGNYFNWPQISEIDILETVNGYDKVWHTLHCGINPGGPCNETSGIGNKGAMSRGEFHTLAVEVDRTSGNWTQQSIRFLVDGEERHRVRGAKVANQTAWAPLVENAKFILLNVAVGGVFPDGAAGVPTPNENTVGGEGAEMEVEYVAVYST